MQLSSANLTCDSSSVAGASGVYRKTPRYEFVSRDRFEKFLTHFGPARSEFECASLPQHEFRFARKRSIVFVEYEPVRDPQRRRNAFAYAHNHTNRRISAGFGPHRIDDDLAGIRRLDPQRGENILQPIGAMNERKAPLRTEQTYRARDPRR
jgi:hypothetical protein